MLNHFEIRSFIISSLPFSPKNLINILPFSLTRISTHIFVWFREFKIHLFVLKTKHITIFKVNRIFQYVKIECITLLLTRWVFRPRTYLMSILTNFEDLVMLVKCQTKSPYGTISSTGNTRLVILGECWLTVRGCLKHYQILRVVLDLADTSRFLSSNWIQIVLQLLIPLSFPRLQ